MIVEKILGNIKDENFKNFKIDYVDVDWFEAQKRILKLTSRNQVSVGVRLDKESQEKGLNQGDVLYVENDTAIVVNIREDDCIVVKIPEEKNRIVKLAWELGNRHTPLFFNETYDNVLFPYDFPLFDMIQKMGFGPERKQDKIHNNLAVSSFINSDHGHDYGYDGEGNMGAPSGCLVLPTTRIPHPLPVPDATVLASLKSRSLLRELDFTPE